MNEISVAICDDDADILSVVTGSISNEFTKHGYHATIELFRNAKEAQQRMKHVTFDPLFLDIDMPGEDGITFAKSLRSHDLSTDIIFLSSREDRVFDALRTGPNGFIRKSSFLKDVADVIALYVKNREKKKGKQLVIEEGDGTRSFDIGQVLYIEGRGKYQEIHLQGNPEPVKVRKTMQEMEDMLSKSGFLRIHKGYLVNYTCIRHLGTAEAELTNGEILPLSRRRVQEIRDAYLALMQDSDVLLL
ncbi:MAG TPA: hypothetical protein DGX96_00435 [Lachnospiraceae bacterium]|jgi:two-component system response regulator LytT|nr:hypothetical protein [Lachnospiraceae bacterium]